MPNTFETSVAGRNIAVNELTKRLNGGALNLYGGPAPASVEEPVPSTAVRLVEARFERPAFKPAVGGRAESHPITSVGSLATGHIEWFRVATPEGTTIWQGTAGETEESDLVLGDSTIHSLKTGFNLSLSYEIPNERGRSAAPEPAAAPAPAAARAPIDSRDVYSRLNRRGR